MTGEAVPTVSIGLPVFNGERYLRNALERLLEQDFRDLELIICDNASRDGTQQLCEEFAEKTIGFGTSGIQKYRPSCEPQPHIRIGSWALFQVGGVRRRLPGINAR